MGRLWVRIALGRIMYLIFSFTRSGKEAKRGDEFRHSSRKIEECFSVKRSIVTLRFQVPSAYPAMYMIQRKAKKKSDKRETGSPIEDSV